MPPVIPQLSEETWVLLAVLHRATHGGPAAVTMTSETFAELYGQLTSKGLITRRGEVWVVTGPGEAALRERYAPD
jgi:hypothetical protein